MRSSGIVRSETLSKAPGMTGKPTLIIDGDMLLYAAAQACEFATTWDDVNYFLTSNIEEAKALIAERITQNEQRFGPEKTIIALSDPDRAANFRMEVDPTYKISRGGRKPLCYWPLEKWLQETYICIWRPRLEADDVMGILATGPNTVDPVMVSDDKDLKTIPGKLWRGDELINTSLEEADFNWLFQTLTGDATDGYSGCPGVGPVTAVKILKKEASFAAVVKAYEKAGLTAEDALRNARLARILRYEDWDRDNLKVKLWQPNHTEDTKEPQVT